MKREITDYNNGRYTETKINKINKLRQEMGIGLNDAKSILSEANWHYNEAVKLVRKKGYAKGGKK